MFHLRDGPKSACYARRGPCAASFSPPRIVAEIGVPLAGERHRHPLAGERHRHPHGRRQIKVNGVEIWADRFSACTFQAICIRHTFEQRVTVVLALRGTYLCIVR
jgi:hypothetical protein